MLVITPDLLRNLREINYSQDPLEREQSFVTLVGESFNALIQEIYQGLPASPDYSSLDAEKFYQLLHLVAQISKKSKLFSKEFVFKILKGLEVIVRDKPPEEADQITIMLWSLASLSPYDQGDAENYDMQAKIEPVLIKLKDLFVKKLIDYSAELTAKHFAKIMWALDTLGYECSLGFRRQTIPAFFARHVDALSDKEFVNVITCMAKLGVKWEDLKHTTREKMLRSLQSKLEAANPPIKSRHFSIILWCLACMEVCWKDLTLIQALVLQIAKTYEKEFSPQSIIQLGQVKAFGFPLEGEWGDVVLDSSQSEFEKSVLKHLKKYFSKQHTDITLSTGRKLLGVHQPDISVLSVIGEPLVHIECDGQLHYFRGNSRTLTPTTAMRNRVYQTNKIPYITIAYWHRNRVDLLERRVDRYLPKKASSYAVHEPAVEKTSATGSRLRTKGGISAASAPLCFRLYDLRERTEGISDFSEEIARDFDAITQVLLAESPEVAQCRVAHDDAKSSSYFIDVVRNILDKVPPESKPALIENIFKCFQSEFYALQGSRKITRKIVVNFLFGLSEIGFVYEKIPSAWFDYLKNTRTLGDEMLDLFSALGHLGGSWDALDSEFRGFLRKSLNKNHAFLNLGDFESLVLSFMRLRISSIDLPSEFLESLKAMKADASLDESSPLRRYAIEEPSNPLADGVALVQAEAAEPDAVAEDVSPLQSGSKDERLTHGVEMTKMSVLDIVSQFQPILKLDPDEFSSYEVYRRAVLEYYGMSQLLLEVNRVVEEIVTLPADVIAERYDIVKLLHVWGFAVRIERHLDAVSFEHLQTILCAILAKETLHVMPAITFFGCVGKFNKTWEDLNVKLQDLILKCLEQCLEKCKQQFSLRIIENLLKSLLSMNYSVSADCNSAIDMMLIEMVEITFEKLSKRYIGKEERGLYKSLMALGIIESRLSLNAQQHCAQILERIPLAAVALTKTSVQKCITGELVKPMVDEVALAQIGAVPDYVSEDERLSRRAEMTTMNILKIITLFQPILELDPVNFRSHKAYQKMLTEQDMPQLLSEVNRVMEEVAASPANVIRVDLGTLKLLHVFGFAFRMGQPLDAVAFERLQIILCTIFSEETLSVKFASGFIQCVCRFDKTWGDLNSQLHDLITSYLERCLDKYLDKFQVGYKLSLGQIESLLKSFISTGYHVSADCHSPLSVILIKMTEIMVKQLSEQDKLDAKKYTRLWEWLSLFRITEANLSEVAQRHCAQISSAAVLREAQQPLAQLEEVFYAVDGVPLLRAASEDECLDQGVEATVKHLLEIVNKFQYILNLKPSKFVSYELCREMVLRSNFYQLTASLNKVVEKIVAFPADSIAKYSEEILEFLHVLGFASQFDRCMGFVSFERLQVILCIILAKAPLHLERGIYSFQCLLKFNKKWNQLDASLRKQMLQYLERHKEEVSLDLLVKLLLAFVKMHYSVSADYKSPLSVLLIAMTESVLAQLSQQALVDIKKYTDLWKHLRTLGITEANLSEVAQQHCAKISPAAALRATSEDECLDQGVEATVKRLLEIVNKFQYILNLKPSKFVSYELYREMVLRSNFYQLTASLNKVVEKIVAFPADSIAKHSEEILKLLYVCGFTSCFEQSMDVVSFEHLQVILRISLAKAPCHLKRGVYFFTCLFKFDKKWNQLDESLREQMLKYLERHKEEVSLDLLVKLSLAFVRIHYSVSADYKSPLSVLLIAMTESVLAQLSRQTAFDLAGYTALWAHLRKLGITNVTLSEVAQQHDIEISKLCHGRMNCLSSRPAVNKVAPAEEKAMSGTIAEICDRFQPILKLDPDKFSSPKAYKEMLLKHGFLELLPKLNQAIEETVALPANNIAEQSKEISRLFYFWELVVQIEKPLDDTSFEHFQTILCAILAKETLPLFHAICFIRFIGNFDKKWETLSSRLQEIIRGCLERCKQQVSLELFDRLLNSFVCMAYPVSLDYQNPLSVTLIEMLEILLAQLSQQALVDIKKYADLWKHLGTLGITEANLSEVAQQYCAKISSAAVLTGAQKTPVQVETKPPMVQSTSAGSSLSSLLKKPISQIPEFVPGAISGMSVSRSSKPRSDKPLSADAPLFSVSVQAQPLASSLLPSQKPLCGWAASSVMQRSSGLLTQPSVPLEGLPFSVPVSYGYQQQQAAQFEQPYCCFYEGGAMMHSAQDGYLAPVMQPLVYSSLYYTQGRAQPPSGAPRNPHYPHP